MQPCRKDTAISPLEPFLIGGVRVSDNIFISETIIPGNVIKGAFAAGLNRMAGLVYHNPITNTHPLKTLFPLTVTHFASIRFHHAFPSREQFLRPETMPLSGVTYGDNYEEIHFCNEKDICARGQTPISFKIDWKKEPKNLPQKYKMPHLEFHVVTHTAIHPESRRAYDGKLYTFHLIKPETTDQDKKNNSPVFWNTQIGCPSFLTKNDQGALVKELWEAIPQALCYIGKRQSSVHVQLRQANPDVNSTTVSFSKTFAIVLQTSALILNPKKIADKASESDIFDDQDILKTFYQDYWRLILADDNLILARYYANQELRGGYLGMRFKQNNYHPFYLTSAGSVFVFDKANNNVFQKALALEYTGLPFPEWAKKDGKQPWEINPFLSENGYGEVKLISQGEYYHE